jgi:predicted pyridoxine 5'-phosphate oxidase superfamily flavin-nucleotide-binding protein
MTSMYHDGHRRLQDRFDSRRIADKLEEVTVHNEFTDKDRALIERSPMFFLATADAEGAPDCSYKGGRRGFVRVVDPRTLAWGDYDGNGQFRSLGNVLVNPRVGLLFVDFEQPRRLRVNGTAAVSESDPLLASFPGARLVVRVTAERIFPNCPRYIHRWRLEELSAYVPEEGVEPPVPDWKRDPRYRDHLPRR